MIRLLVFLIIFNIISYGNKHFQIDFFYPDKEYFAYTNRMPEHEFNYFLENHPYNIAKTPLLIVKFIPPSPFYKIEQNKIKFYLNKRYSKLEDVFIFNIFTLANEKIKPLILGSRKSYTPFGNNKEYLKTFYIALPEKIMNEKKIYIFIRNRDNKLLEKSKVELKNVNSKDTYIQNRFQIIDNAGNLFFNIECVKEPGEMNIKIKVKNLTDNFITFSTTDFIINANNKYFHSIGKEIISLNPGESKNFSIIFQIKNIPIFSITTYTIIFNSKISNFKKTIRL